MVMSDKLLVYEGKEGKDEETMAKWKGHFGEWRRAACPVFIQRPPILTRLMDLITGKLLTRPEWIGVAVILSQVLCNSFTRYGRESRHLKPWRLLCGSEHTSRTYFFSTLLHTPIRSPSLLQTALIFILNGI